MRLTIRTLATLAAEEFGSSPRLVFSDTLTREAVLPRQVAMFLAHVRLGKTLQEIGRAFGGKDHTTILHAVRKVRHRLAEDVKFAAQIERIWQAASVLQTTPEPPVAVVAPPIEPEPLLYWGRLADAVGRYLAARERQDRDAFTKSEAAARRDADAALNGLRTAFAAIPEPKRKAAA